MLACQMHTHAAGHRQLTLSNIPAGCVGAQYAVSTRAEDKHKPTYAVFPDSSNVLRPIKRRATVIRSEDVVTLFSTAPKKPITSPIKLKSVAAGPETVEVVLPEANLLKPQQASPLVSPTETPRKKEKRHKKRKPDQERDEELPAVTQATAATSEKVRIFRPLFFREPYACDG